MQNHINALLDIWEKREAYDIVFGAVHNKCPHCGGDTEGESCCVREDADRALANWCADAAAEDAARFNINTDDNEDTNV